MSLLAKAAAVLALSTVVGTAGAGVISGNFNQHGYAVLDIAVKSTSTVDFLYTDGYGDATFSLFNASGNHLLSNDDSNGLNPHITQTLTAGNYSFLVSYCCGVFGALHGGSHADSDGFNSGYYVFGGGATLSSATAYLNQMNHAAGANYVFTMTNAEIRGEVPEPHSIALFGVALAGLGMARRRKNA